MLARGGLFCLFVVVGIVISQNSDDTPLVLGYLSKSDKLRLKQNFDRHLTSPLTDVKNVHYSLFGLASLGEKAAKEDDACNLFKNSIAKASIETAYHCYLGARHLGAGRCNLPTDILDKLAADKMKNGIVAEDLFYTISALEVVKKKIDQAKVLTLVEEIIKTDNSATTMGFVFHSLAIAGLNKVQLKKYMDIIPDVISQADEADGLYSFFDNGLYTTALVIDGIFKMASAYGQAPDIPEHKLVKLTNFLYSRRQTYQARTAAHTVAALRTLSTNKFMIPLTFVNAGENSGKGNSGLFGLSVSPNSPTLRFRVCNVFGDPWLTSEKVILTAGSVLTATETKTIVGPASRGLLKSVGSDVFEISLIDKDNLPRGFYHLEMTVSPKASAGAMKYIGTNKAKLLLRSVVDVKVKLAELKKLENENNKVVLSENLQSGVPSKTPIVLDGGTRLLLHLHLMDAAKAPLLVHQVFLQLTHSTTGRQITYIGTEKKDSTSNTKYYFFKLDMDLAGEDFDFLNGKYKMELLIGDALIAKPMAWHMADLQLSFDSGVEGSDSARRSQEALDISKQQVQSAAAVRRSPIIGSGPSTKAKPELRHTFREPEKRASTTLAMLFTGISVFLLLALLVMWLVIGVNLWNFPFRLSAFVFHGGLIGIFVLYYQYWLRLDMFTTLRWLACLGLPTFLAGNSLLRHIVAQRYLSAGGTAAIHSSAAATVAAKKND